MMRRAQMISTPIHKSRPPLRWAANAFSRVSTNYLLEAFRLQEHGCLETSFKFRYATRMYSILNWPYARWGTVHRFTTRENLHDSVLGEE